MFQVHLSLESREESFSQKRRWNRINAWSLFLFSFPFSSSLDFLKCLFSNWAFKYTICEQNCPFYFQGNWTTFFTFHFPVEKSRCFLYWAAHWVISCKGNLSITEQIGMAMTFRTRMVRPSPCWWTASTSCAMESILISLCFHWKHQRNDHCLSLTLGLRLMGAGFLSRILWAIEQLMGNRTAR